MELTLQAAVVALAVLELVKLFIRKVILKNPEYEFPPIYYTLLIPFLTALAGYGLGYIGWAAPIVLEGQAVLQWATAILFELLFYHMGVEPLKTYARTRNGA